MTGKTNHTHGRGVPRGFVFGGPRIHFKPNVKVREPKRVLGTKLPSQVKSLLPVTRGRETKSQAQFRRGKTAFEAIKGKGVMGKITKGFSGMLHR